MGDGSATGGDTLARRSYGPGMGDVERWTVPDLRDELEQYERELRAAGMAESTVHTYVDRAARFVAWLAGECRPQR